MKSLILCEGKNDKDFFKILLDDLKINSVDIEIMKNKSNFFKIDSYQTIKPKIELLYKKVLFVIDADYEKNDTTYGGYNNTENEIKKTITELKIEDKADIFIMSDPISQDGYLESFLLSTIGDKKECIDNFIECSKYKDRENHKAIINQIYKIGYPDDSFDFSHAHFEILKSKLFNLIKDD